MLGTTHIIVDELDEDEIPYNEKLIERFGTNTSNSVASSPPSSFFQFNLNFNENFSTNPNHGHGILLSLIPSLLINFPHLKIVLIVNKRPSFKNVYCKGMNLSDIKHNQSSLIDTNFTDQSLIALKNSHLALFNEKKVMIQCYF